MPLRREAHRLLTRMTQRIDERSALVREIRKANLDAEDESWKRIDDSRKLLAETADIPKGYSPTKRGVVRYLLPSRIWLPASLASEIPLKGHHLKLTAAW